MTEFMPQIMYNVRGRLIHKIKIVYQIIIPTLGGRLIFEVDLYTSQYGNIVPLFFLYVKFDADYDRCFLYTKSLTQTMTDVSYT